MHSFEKRTATLAAAVLACFICAAPIHAMPVPSIVHAPTLPVKAPTPAVAPAPPVAAPSPRAAPAIADSWFKVEYVSTKHGPRLCPPGVNIANSLTRYCDGNSAPITAREYFAKACPAATLLSVTPYGYHAAQYIVFGYTEGETPCALPARAYLP